MIRYCPHQPTAVTLGYRQRDGGYESATLSTDFEVARPSLPFTTAFFFSAAGDQTWQHFAEAAGLDVYLGWVQWPTGVDHGCWLSGLSHDDVDTLRRIVRQERLVRWTYWAVTIWPVADDPYRLDLAWFPTATAARSDPHTPASRPSSQILRRAS